jgi:hypothetical protein
VSARVADELDSLASLWRPMERNRKNGKT